MRLPAPRAVAFTLSSHRWIWERTYYGDVPHSYIVEFKHLKKGAKKSDTDAQRKEGVAQLKAYAKDKKIPSLAKGTTLHLLLVQYRGPRMIRCELVGEKAFA